MLANEWINNLSKKWKLQILSQTPISPEELERIQDSHLEQIQKHRIEISSLNSQINSLENEIGRFKTTSIPETPSADNESQSATQEQIWAKDLDKLNVENYSLMESALGLASQGLPRNNLPDVRMLPLLNAFDLVDIDANTRLSLTKKGKFFLKNFLTD